MCALTIFGISKIPTHCLKEALVTWPLSASGLFFPLTNIWHCCNILTFPNRSFSLSRNKKLNWKLSSGRSQENECYKILIYKQFVQVSGLCGPSYHRGYICMVTPYWCTVLCTNMAAGNQQKHLEFTFSVKSHSFHSRTSIRRHKYIL